MPPSVAAATLVALAVALAWPAPRLMARRRAFRQAPRAALVVWQAVALAAVLSALFAAPVIAHLLADGHLSDHPLLLAVATAVSLLVFVRLLVSGHRVGTRIRDVRQRHDDLVALLGTRHDEAIGGRLDRAPLAFHVIEHPTPTAYCIPGGSAGVVLSQGTIDRLGPEQLDAVLEHERAHLRARHDLVVEFFTVLHESVPAIVRTEPAMREVRLLVEVLADRASAARVGAVPLASALVSLASRRSTPVAGTLGVNDASTAAAVRIGLSDTSHAREAALSAVMYAFAVAVIALPVIVLIAAFRD